jgi:hypothetical protein
MLFYACEDAFCERKLQVPSVAEYLLSHFRKCEILYIKTARHSVADIGKNAAGSI